MLACESHQHAGDSIVNATICLAHAMSMCQRDIALLANVNVKTVTARCNGNPKHHHNWNRIEALLPGKSSNIGIITLLWQTLCKPYYCKVQFYNTIVTMARSIRLLAVIKQQLKQQGITYKKLACELSLTESAIKQMFAADNMSLKRMDAICEILKLDISDLVAISEDQENRIELLTVEQEAMLIGNQKLLLVAYCVVNHWSFEEIITRYELSEPECIRQLVKLDKMKLIELLPGNRIKALIAPNFAWQPNGPIEHFFRNEVQNAFFDDSFDEQGCIRLVKNGDMSLAARKQLVDRLKVIGQAFDDTNRVERKLSSDDRQGTTMVLAIRNWQFQAFVSLERNAG